jgi:hypothetical protein
MYMSNRTIYALKPWMITPVDVRPVAVLECHEAVQLHVTSWSLLATWTQDKVYCLKINAKFILISRLSDATQQLVVTSLQAL